MSRERQLAAAVLLAAAMGFVLVGCGTPGAPLPPSLNLPDRVDDLTAVRTGNQVTLHWTMPLRNTDKLMLKGQIDVHICRSENPGTESTANCAEAGRMSLAPGAAGGFSE